jgi:hypothetical protein
MDVSAKSAFYLQEGGEVWFTRMMCRDGCYVVFFIAMMPRNVPMATPIQSRNM